MENKTTILDPILERAETFGKTSLELFKLQTIEKFTKFISHVVSRSIAFFVLSLFIIMLSIGASIWLGDLLGRMYYGFLCVAVFHFIIGCIIYFFMHNWIKKQVSDAIITEMLN